MSEGKINPETPDEDAIAKQEAEAAEIKKNIDAQLDKQKDIFRNRFKFLREFMAKCNGLSNSLLPKSLEEKMSYEGSISKDRLTEARMWTERMHQLVLKRCHFIDVVQEEEKIPIDKHATIDFVVTEGDFLTKTNDEINNFISLIQNEQPITNDHFEAWMGTYITERLMEAQMWLREI